MIPDIPYEFSVSLNFSSFSSSITSSSYFPKNDISLFLTFYTILFKTFSLSLFSPSISGPLSNPFYSIPTVFIDVYGITYPFSPIPY
jgi:hypothetical protein